MTKFVAFGECVDLDVLIAAIAEPLEVPHLHILCTFVPVLMLILASGPLSVLRPFRTFLFVPLLFDFDFRKDCAQCGSVAFLSSVNGPSPE